MLLSHFLYKDTLRTITSCREEREKKRKKKETRRGRKEEGEKEREGKRNDRREGKRKIKRISIKRGEIKGERGQRTTDLSGTVRQDVDCI